MNEVLARRSEKAGNVNAYVCQNKNRNYGDETHDEAVFDHCLSILRISMCWKEHVRRRTAVATC